VNTVDNFGVTGEAPSHPELLDYLAGDFIRDGWSVKKLIRKLVLSRAYQLGGDAPAGHLGVDPANRLVWRHSPRRLEAEEIRDAILAAAGTLDPARIQGSPAAAFKVIEMANNGADARRLGELAALSRHRSVYLPLLRGLTPHSLQVFDFAEQGMVTGSRDTTTVASQALYFLNDPFIRRQSVNLAQRLFQRSDLDEAARLQLAYRLTLGREASAHEIERSRSYIAGCQSSAAASAQPAGEAKREIAAWSSFCQALLASAEFRYVR
jgi:hypothetical protein